MTIKGNPYILEFQYITNNQSDEFNKWLDWAKKKADWYDPQINAVDEILREVNKEQLTF